MNLIKKSLFLACMTLFGLANAQVGINTTGADPDPSAMLDVVSTTQGMLIPRMTEMQKTMILNPAVGLMVYQSDGASGFYYYNGSQWVVMGDAINESGYPDLHLGKFVVQSSLCVGLDCVNGESFGFGTIKLKENNTRIYFDDTSGSPFPDNDWNLEANESFSGGLSGFFLTDATNGQRPFFVKANAGDDAIYVLDGGNVGLGTNTPMEKLHVNGNLHADGNITATGTIMSSSDRRLKENIRPIDHALGLISQLRPKQYQFKTSEFPALHLPGTSQYGLIAQDVKLVLPQLVEQHAMVIDEKGTTEELMSVNYLGLIPILIKGIQEQQVQIDAQKATLAPLQLELAELQARQVKFAALLQAISADRSGVDKVTSEKK
ncbi:MAG: tail fiber domain-containing protein [Saprospiraceae bacterium]